MNLNFSDDGDGDFPILPTGAHQVAFCALQDIGLHKGFYDEAPSPKYVMWFQTEETESNKEGIDQIFKLRSKPLLQSTSSRSNLTKYFLALMGGKPDESLIPESGQIDAAELAEKLVGNNVTVTVVHSEDGKWANISDIAPVPAKRRTDVSADGFEIPGKKDDKDAK